MFGVMPATAQLKEEHRVIERVLEVLRPASDRLEEGENVPLEVFEDSVEFVREFADRCHHGKEENVLFPLLKKKGLPEEGGPIGVMKGEHRQGRSFVGALAVAVESYAKGDTGAKRDIIENARAYVRLLRDHIAMEDGVLFPMGDSLLGEDEQTQLMQRFEDVEEKEIGHGKHHHYIELVEGMERKVGIRE